MSRLEQIRAKLANATEEMEGNPGDQFAIGQILTDMRDALKLIADELESLEKTATEHAHAFLELREGGAK